MSILGYRKTNGRTSIVIIVQIEGLCNCNFYDIQHLHIDLKNSSIIFTSYFDPKIPLS